MKRAMPWPCTELPQRLTDAPAWMNKEHLKSRPAEWCAMSPAGPNQTAVFAVRQGSSQSPYHHILPVLKGVGVVHQEGCLCSDDLRLQQPCL